MEKCFLILWWTAIRWGLMEHEITSQRKQDRYIFGILKCNDEQSFSGFGNIYKDIINKS